MMMNATALFRTALAGALVAAVSAPAFAGESDKDGQKITYNAKTGKYCAKLEFTGSRMGKSVCRTREQWAAQGVTIPTSEAVAANAARDPAKPN